MMGSNLLFCKCFRYSDGRRYLPLKSAPGRRRIMRMNTIAVILARAGSKGLPDKCVLPLLGRPVISYTIEHAQASGLLGEIILSTDSPRAAAIGRRWGVQTVDRPAELAIDTARVDASVRHAVQWHERRTGAGVEAIVILYGNIPVRADGIIDRCVEHLQSSQASSVRTVAPVTKQHPDWIHRLDGDVMIQFRPNSIHRRQDLEPLYYHDGAVIAVRRASLFAPETRDDPHAFFGPDRRAIVQQPEDTVDIDTPVDLYLAEAILRCRQEASRRSGTRAEARFAHVKAGTERPGAEPVLAMLSGAEDVP
jgi:CMP-N,N'-diacetyllegionaminic acid synthase